MIVCPSYLKQKWKYEIKKIYPDAVVTVFKNASEFYHLFDTDFAIMSYSFLEKAEILFEWAEAIIADEAQFLKETGAKRTDHFHRLVYENSNKYLMLLTGTPIVNRVYEFYSLITLCHYNPEIDGKAYLEKFPTFVDFADAFSYREEYTIKVKTKKGRLVDHTVKKWSGFKNGELLRQYTKNCLIRFETDKVTDLPKINYIDIPVNYDDKDESLLEEFAKYAEDAEDGGMGSTIKREAAMATAVFTAEYAAGLVEQGLPVVIYTDHVASCEAIAKKLKCRPIHGGTPMKVRQEIGQDFQAGKLDVVVATYGAFSTGVDLFRSSNLILNDPPWVPGVLEQAIYRIRRIGQTGGCNIHRIMGTFATQTIYGVIVEKLKTISKVFAEDSG